MVEYKEQVRQIMRLIEDEAPAYKVREAARAAKDIYAAEFQSLWQALSAVDNLVALFAPAEDYLIGWPQKSGVVGPVGRTSGSASAQGQPRRPTRRERVLEIARKQAESGDRTATAKAVAEQLQREGDGTPIKNLAVSAGNVLARSEDWEIVSPGTYQLREEVG